jgi:hypothetical protein
MFTYTQYGPKFMSIKNRIISLDGIKHIKKITGVNPHILIYYFGECESGPIVIDDDDLDEIYANIKRALMN